MTAFKISNLWKQYDPRAKLVPIVSLQFHPKDIGSLLIGYSEGAVLYSFKQNKATKFFKYELPKGAVGGISGSRTISQSRSPKLTHAIWHPTGTFILTAHDDTGLVFWDLKDGRIIESRTIEDVGIHLPGSQSQSGSKQPYIKISWCSKENPDDTGILLNGGQSSGTGLSFIDLGLTPNYQTSTWDFLTNHFRNPKRVHVLPTPPNTVVSNYILIPRSSPHFSGSHDPIAIIAALSSGELITMSFPTGHPISPTNQLHVSLSLVHPFVTKFSLASIERSRWLGLKETRQQGPNFLLGGAEAIKPMKRHENRNIISAAHVDGTIRIWDVGAGDEIENGGVLQADLARAVGRWDIDVTKMTMSDSTCELVVGLKTGEVVVFRLNRNLNFGKPSVPFENSGPGQMTDISRRADPGLKEGLIPLTMTNDQQGSVTALKLSNVGFLVAGYENGGISVTDLRGPAIIHTTLLQDLGKTSKRGRIDGEYCTVFEFGIMTLEGDGEF